MKFLGADILKSKWILVFISIFPVFFFIGSNSFITEDSRIESLRKAAEYLEKVNPEDPYLLEAIDQLNTLKTSDEGSFKTVQKKIMLSHPAFNQDILMITRKQYQPDHHNTATLFQKDEINDFKFDGGATLQRINLRSGKKQILFSTTEGVVRDPELSYDGSEIVFSYRKNIDDDYHIYKISSDGNNFRQITFDAGISDIDPVFLPDGDFLFSSTREPKYCMCNRHIMANLYRMETDGANIVQLSKNTLFEGHASVLNDGRIIYDRWEYVDRNFGDAQGLWTTNPDGTNQAIFYGNNMNSPGGVIDPRAIPGSSRVSCIFGSCHDRPWGALAIIDRTKGVDGEASVIQIWPEEARSMIGIGDWDKFMELKIRYEDPYPLDEQFILCSKTIKKNNPVDEKMGIYLLDRFGNEVLLFEDNDSCFDPMPISARDKGSIIPVRTQYDNSPGYFYVQNVYEGTHMEGIDPGSIKYFRIVETPEKQTFTLDAWGGQGQQAPGMNWHSFESKRILGEAEVEKDGSVYVEIPSGKFVYFQLLDENRKMIQSMRSGTMVQAGEVRGCIGCHEDRLSVPVNQKNLPMAMKKGPVSFLNSGVSPEVFSYTEEIQPIFDKNCINCHDFGPENESGLILSGDKNPFFNASYIDLQVKGIINSIGAGPADIQNALTWGSKVSILVSIIDSLHHDINLTNLEKEKLYTWIDLNAVYYPFYESAYPDNPAGRSPLTFIELEELGNLTKTDFNDLKVHSRSAGPQISFDRPELSPCLKNLKKGSKKYQQAVDIIYIGKERLQLTPRADMTGFEPSKDQKLKVKKYQIQLEKEKRFREAIANGVKRYDQKQ